MTALLREWYCQTATLKRLLQSIRSDRRDVRNCQMNSTTFTMRRNMHCNASNSPTTQRHNIFIMASVVRQILCIRSYSNCCEGVVRNIPNGDALYIIRHRLNTCITDTHYSTTYVHPHNGTFNTTPFLHI